MTAHNPIPTTGHFILSCLSYACPKLCGHASSTPKRERWTNGVSEINGSQGFMGDDEVRNEDYRCGGPVLAKMPASIKPHPIQDIIFPRPSESHLQPSSDPPEESTLKKVEAVLRTWEISWSEIKFVKRVPYDTQFPSINTILIRSYRRELDRSWYNACKDIIPLLAPLKPPFSVEILDNRARGCPAISDIDSDDPIYLISKSLNQELREAIPELSGLYMCLVALSAPLLELNSTVFVSVPENLVDTCDWSGVRDQIITVLDDIGLYHISVMIYAGPLPVHCPLIERKVRTAKGFLVVSGE
ncbi:hypothetical protein MauCBS54593_001926 [Microsporum audouinii]